MKSWSLMPWSICFIISRDILSPSKIRWLTTASASALGTKTSLPTLTVVFHPKTRFLR